MFESRWMRRWQARDVSTDDKTHITGHLLRFKRASNLQSGVTALLVNLCLEAEEMSTLRRVFLALDTDRDGMLSLSELETSMDQ